MYGTPRILADLPDAGVRVSRKTVAASLRHQGLAGTNPRRFAPAPDLAHRSERARSPPLRTEVVAWIERSHTGAADSPPSAG